MEKSILLNINCLKNSNSGNNYVISDVHGCSKTLKELVNKIGLNKNDYLFLLGDYIDRGIDSAGVLDFLIELKVEFNVFPLLGNHEENLLFLDNLQNINLIKRYVEKGNANRLLNNSNKLHLKYKSFLQEMPYYLIYENYILVHAGLNFNCKNPLDKKDEMLWIRNFDYDALKVQNRKIIHGHTPHVLNEIIERIENNSNVIPLDNGCVYKDNKGMGNLICLNLNNFELIIQKNIDF